MIVRLLQISCAMSVNCVVFSCIALTSSLHDSKLSGRYYSNRSSIDFVLKKPKNIVIFAGICLNRIRKDHNKIRRYERALFQFFPLLANLPSYSLTFAAEQYMMHVHLAYICVFFQSNLSYLHYC